MRLTEHSNVGPYPEQPSHEPHSSQFLKFKDALRAVHPQRCPFRPWTPCATWRLGMKTKQHPHKLSSTTARFRNQTFRVSRRTWSRNAAPESSAFSPVTKTTTHFANVPTATKERTQLRKVKLHTSVPLPSTTTTTLLCWPFCTAQNNHAHYFWDRPCTLEIPVPALTKANPDSHPRGGPLKVIVQNKKKEQLLGILT